MGTTINIDEELLTKARRLTGINGRADLVREGLRSLIERESARRLARLGGSQPFWANVAATWIGLARLGGSQPT